MSEPSWAETIKGAIERSLDGVHTSIPAQVRTYLPATQQCSVEPVIPGMPVLEDVPVLWPRGGGHFVHLPLTTGDHVLITFCEQDFSPWRLSGSATAPALLRRHGLFAFAIPGAAPDTDPILEATISTATGVLLGQESGPLIHVGPTGIDLGAFPSAQAVALAALVDAINSAMASWATAHTHSFSGVTASACTAGGAAGTCTGTTGAPTGAAPTPSTVASTIVRCLS